MANPRQRRKSRSSSYKPVSHSRNAKRNLKKTPPIRGPKVLQDAWDKQKTVRQNYANLGLVVTLDPSAHGGVEKPLRAMSAIQVSHEQEAAPSSSTPNNASPSVPSGFGRILRDAAGNILGFEMNEEQTPEEQPETADMEEDLESRMDQDVREKWATDFSRSTASQLGPINESLVHQLEQISASATGMTTLSLPLSGVGSRHVSSGETKYLDRLVKKYGNNVDGMAGDLKLNPEQRTVGQLRRALKKVSWYVYRGA
ncbi:ribosome biogenesis protein Nop16 [Flammula alnicola]|nr:ribosome biogenesis protein Nop16 [Flammula alnicola]